MWAFLRWLSTLCYYDLGIRTVSRNTLKQLCNARKYPFPHPQTKGGNFCFRPAFRRILSYPPSPGISHKHDQGSMADPGEGPGGPTPPYFYTKMKPEGPKKFFLSPPPPPSYLRVWMTAPPPTPLIWRSGSATGAFNKHRRPTKHVGYFAHRSRLIFPRKKKQLVWITL